MGRREGRETDHTSSTVLICQHHAKFLFSPGMAVSRSFGKAVAGVLEPRFFFFFLSGDEKIAVAGP